MFLFCLLGSTLFVDKTSDRTRVELFEFVRMADSIRKYAWGTATLAWLYNQLGRLLEPIYLDVQGVYIYCSGGFTSIPRILCILWYILSHKECEPVSGRWASTDTTADGLDGRDSLELEDVTWLPFGPDPAERI
ncbi:hypothetical protein LINGRAHAP2_LOCUS4305 [Linum grandiflorum]